MKKVLIAYITKTNTTKEAAGIIGEELTKNGMEPEILRFDEVTDLSGYDAAILGAPINGMTWHTAAIKFVEDHRTELSKMPTSYFFMSYLLFTGCNIWKNAIRKSLKGVSMIVKPVKIGMFGGKVESEFPGFVRFLFGVKKGAPLDVRDPDKVRVWAQEWVTEHTVPGSGNI